MGRMAGIKWEKSARCAPIHNIISSDFPKYNPQPWKFMVRSVYLPIMDHVMRFMSYVANKYLPFVDSKHLIIIIINNLLVITYMILVHCWKTCQGARSLALHRQLLATLRRSSPHLAEGRISTQVFVSSNDCKFFGKQIRPFTFFSLLILSSIPTL